MKKKDLVIGKIYRAFVNNQDSTDTPNGTIVRILDNKNSLSNHYDGVIVKIINSPELNIIGHKGWSIDPRFLKEL